jgi:hypothetical protein
MKYAKKGTIDTDRHPSIHYTGSVRGMKKLGFWGKTDNCIRIGNYIYNISIVIGGNADGNGTRS